MRVYDKWRRPMPLERKEIIAIQETISNETKKNLTIRRDSPESRGLTLVSPITSQTFKKFSEASALTIFDLCLVVIRESGQQWPHVDQILRAIRTRFGLDKRKDVGRLACAVPLKIIASLKISVAIVST